MVSSILRHPHGCCLHGAWKLHEAVLHAEVSCCWPLDAVSLARCSVIRGGSDGVAGGDGAGGGAGVAAACHLRAAGAMLVFGYSMAIFIAAIDIAR